MGKQLFSIRNMRELVPMYKKNRKKFNQKTDKLIWGGK